MNVQIPANITNQKTLRKWEAHAKQWDEIVKFAKDSRCVVFKRGTNNWGFRRNGEESPYGFDTEGEVYIFIQKHNGNTGII